MESSNYLVTYGSKPFITINTQPMLDAYCVAKQTATSIGNKACDVGQKAANYVNLDSSKLAYGLSAATTVASAIRGFSPLTIALFLITAGAQKYNLDKAKRDGFTVESQDSFYRTRGNINTTALAQLAKLVAGPSYNVLIGALQLGSLASKHVETPFGFEVNR